ncbi:hypothetical protein E5S67_01823 [Microcoleus sp. IPMA8]|uniref:Transposase n=1 Tax=Microcoleus asticus IPMA8 TaxID=2563858 RepID=A0ABX2CXG4_9CYAN|nr:hypothetical protein [Microcoleus asticus IPMA8]
MQFIVLSSARSTNIIFITPQRYLINADVNGSMNIGRKLAANGFLPDPVEALVVGPVRFKPYKQKNMV